MYKRDKDRVNFFVLILLCLVLVSCTSSNKDIVMPQYQEGSGLKNEFFTKYDTLKQRETWHDIIDLGSQALKYDALTNEERAKINLRLASSYYYTGDFEKAAVSAENGRLSSIDNPDSLARSYYLISACNRAMSLSYGDHKTNEYVKVAHDSINKALALVNNGSVSDFTKAKIYFNAGALAQDVDKNYFSASKYYLQAMDLFSQDRDNKDDYNRTVIRYIRSQLELGNVDLAQVKAEELSMIISKNTRTGIHLLELQSKIALKQGKFEESYKKVEQALELATKKGMKADIERLEEFKQHIGTGL